MSDLFFHAFASDSSHGYLNFISQRLARDLLSNFIFLTAGKVGSSTDLIVQRVEFVPDIDKRDYLVNLLHFQRENRTPAKVCLLTSTVSLSIFMIKLVLLP